MVRNRRIEFMDKNLFPMSSGANGPVLSTLRVDSIVIVPNIKVFQDLTKSNMIMRQGFAREGENNEREKNHT